MKHIWWPLFFIVITGSVQAQNNPDFTIAFGSCNKTSLPNLLWDDIVAAQADVFMWG